MVTRRRRYQTTTRPFFALRPAHFHSAPVFSLSPCIFTWSLFFHSTLSHSAPVFHLDPVFSLDPCIFTQTLFFFFTRTQYFHLAPVFSLRPCIFTERLYFHLAPVFSLDPCIYTHQRLRCHGDDDDGDRVMTWRWRAQLTKQPMKRRMYCAD